MRHIVIIVMAVIIWLLTIVLKNHREKIIIAGIAVISIVSGIYSYANAGKVLSTRSFREQTLYSKDYVAGGEYPDAFLRLFLKDKKVYIKRDPVKMKEAEEMGVYWVYSLYHMRNMTSYLRSIDADLIKEDEMNEDAVPESLAGDFEKLGYTNDFMRNTMLYTKHDMESGNYLYFLNYYRDLSDTAYFYINSDSLNGDDEYVLLWQPRSEEDLITEDMYLMGRKYYEENVKDAK